MLDQIPTADLIAEFQSLSTDQLKARLHRLEQQSHWGFRQLREHKALLGALVSHRVLNKLDNADK